MALFKVCRGKEAKLPSAKTDGYAYFCTDTENFYIDWDNGSGTITRSQINADFANGIRYLSSGNYIEISASKINSHLNNTSNPHKVTAAQTNAVPVTRTINGQALSKNLTLDDIGVTSAISKSESKLGTRIDKLEDAMDGKLTSTSPVPLDKGGTGATSASAALTKLGAVNKAGDTMTGRLILPFLRLNPNSDFPALEIYSGGSLIATWNWNKNTRRTQMVNYSPNTDYREIFSSPAADSDLTEDKYYEFLTSKSPVTVAQGGTGASTAAGAREKLGVNGTLKISTAWTNSSPSSSFAAQTITMSSVSDFDIAFLIVEYRGKASDGGSILNAIVFPNHGTISHYHNGSTLITRNIEISDTSVVFKDCYAGSSVDNTYLVPYRIYAIHKA